VANIFPNNNLPVSSQQWGREIQKRLENLESNFSLQKTNTSTVDSQLQSSYKRLDQTVRNLGRVDVDVAQITQIADSAINAANTSLAGLNSLASPGSPYPVNAANLSGTLLPATADSILYPAITRLVVTSSGTSAYLFNNQYSGNNPTIYAISGTTIAFKLEVPGHPFLIKTALGVANYDVGLIHVETDGIVSTGSSAQGKTSGTLYWQVPANISGDFAYQCSIHSAMLGVVTIKDISLI
jgi:plastocyanin